MLLYDHAARYVGEVQERPGNVDHPFILWCLESCFDYRTITLHDEIPWCSAFVNRLAWDLRLVRSKSARARSWLEVAISLSADELVVGNDIVIVSRGSNPTLGHVGVFAGWENSNQIRLIGGNQSNGVSIASYPVMSVVGYRRLTSA